MRLEHFEKDDKSYVECIQKAQQGFLKLMQERTQGIVDHLKLDEKHFS